MDRPLVQLSTPALKSPRTTALRIPLRTRPTGADTVIPSTGPPGSTGRPALVLGKVQTRSHEYDTERHETNYGKIGHHGLFLSELKEAQAWYYGAGLLPARLFRCSYVNNHISRVKLEIRISKY